MKDIKKGAVIFYFFLILISLRTSYAQTDLGCCTNPGAGPLTCSTERLVRNAECCPTPEANFPSYYRSTQNPNNPSNANECRTNFFFSNAACATINACALGCCCSGTGGTITSEAQCRASGLTFHRGQTNCNQVCQVAQCNDNIDNDNNGCADLDDTGCTSLTDTTEANGNCIVDRCANPSYVPRLSSFEVTPAKGQRKFSLNWLDECTQTVSFYEVSRCEGNNCTNFALVATTNANSFEDESGNLLFDTMYTYQIKAYYNLQTVTPTITKTATLGNIECLGKLTANTFCLNNTIVSCNEANRLQRGQTCSSTQVCVINNNQASCINKANCNYNSANPFGLYYTLQGCEAGRYCFYDRSHSTVNSCFSCDPSMACYDYKTEEACSRDNCRVGNCRWKNLANQIGIGVCVKTNEYNCQWCDKRGAAALENLRAYNEIFDLCTKEKSDKLAEGNFKCYFSNGQSKNCNEVVCADYNASQCSDSLIRHDENNRIINPSNDECGIRICQNINNACVKNADSDNNADCDNAICERDYFAPNTTISPTRNRQGIVNGLIIQINDVTNANGPISLRTTSDYITFLCVGPCATGHPYNIYTRSRRIMISGLDAFDAGNGSRLLSLNEGANVIRYYSQDPSKNIEEVKRITIEAFRNLTGPRILSISVTNGSRIQDRFFTSNQIPTITIQFTEPAIVTFARLISRDGTRRVNLQGNTQLNQVVNLAVPETLPNEEYLFELNARNNHNILMEPPFSASIVIDNRAPSLNITPSNNTVLTASQVTIRLAFDEEVALQETRINSEDIKNLFSTTNNRIFIATLNLSEGNKNLQVTANDFARNQVSGSALFTVDANPTEIRLVRPKFGTASAYTFNIVVETDNDAVCRYSLDDDFEFEFMNQFTATGGATHTISSFNLPSGAATQRLYVKCNDARYGLASKYFDINVDTTPPQIRNAFAFPNPVIERPFNTTLTVETDEPSICKYSSSPTNFDSMLKFQGFDEGLFRTINRQNITLSNEGNFVYYVACSNKAELVSDTKDIQIRVDLSLPLRIVSHTPDFFNTTDAVLAIETNKKSQCKYSETDQNVDSGAVFGPSGYTHTRQLSLEHGDYRFYIKCRDQYLQQFSDVLTIRFTVDVTPPVMLYVNDTSTLELFPEKTCQRDRLRVRWLGRDDESRVKEYFYMLLKDNQPVSSLINSFVSDQWVWVENLNLEDRAQYFFRVYAKNFVGLESDSMSSNGIIVDTSVCQNATQNITISCRDRGNCGLNEFCNDNSDCESRFCLSNQCKQPSCNDGLKNQDEADIDCGEQCNKCSNDKACRIDNDCQSNFCSFGTCKDLDICYDTKLSPGEADVDCGGACATKCSEGKSCTVNNDCEDGLECASSLCKLPERPSLDSDGDGLPDDWEIQNGLNPNDPNDANLDPDNDGLTNREEFDVQRTYSQSTDPNNADTDGDAFSDKKEIDNGTDPIDPEEFPKSNSTKIILFILGIAILLSGFGYLAYRAIETRKKEKIGFKPREISRVTPPTRFIPPQSRLPLRRREEITEVLKKKEEEKTKERERLFETFGKEEKKEPEKPAPIAKEEIKTKEIKDKATIKAKKRISKPKEDVFVKLKEIAKETKKRKKAKHKNVKTSKITS